MVKFIITRDLLAGLKFRVMTDSDRNGFDGLDSPVPLIAETSDGKYIVVLDGDLCEVYGDQEDGSFEMVARQLNIRALPMPQY
jgi:hypothetical protein